MICENCGKPLENNNMVTDTKEDGSVHLFCRNCATLFGTCAMCAHTYCGFFNDPDPMPRFIMVAHKTQQGNTTIVEQRQIPNPDRVKKFCVETECKCLINIDEHPLCCCYGGYKTCSNYCEKDQFNFVQNFPEQEVIEN